MTSSAKWNLRPRRSVFMRGNRQKSHVRDQVITEGVAKWWPVAFASCSCTRTERCVRALSCSSSQFLLRQISGCLRRRDIVREGTYQGLHTKFVTELNPVNDQEFPCSGFCLQVHFLGWIPCKQFHLNKKNSSSITLPFVLSCCGFFWRGDTSVFRVADCRFSYGWYRKHHLSFPLMNRMRNIGSSSLLPTRSPNIVIRSPRWLLQDAWHTVLGTTRHVEFISYNCVARTMADPYCCLEVVY